MERLITHGNHKAESRFIVDMNGEDSGANIISRSVARDDSYQLFQSVLNGNAKCSGHTECDAIIVGNAKISSIPEITANNSDAALIHEAAIDSGTYRRGSGRADHQRLPEIIRRILDSFSDKIETTVNKYCK